MLHELTLSTRSVFHQSPFLALFAAPVAFCNDEFSPTAQELACYTVGEKDVAGSCGILRNFAGHPSVHGYVILSCLRNCFHILGCSLKACSNLSMFVRITSFEQLQLLVLKT